MLDKANTIFYNIIYKIRQGEYMIASIIDSYVTEREEFQLVRGYQPFDSLFYIKEGSFCCDFGFEKEYIRAGEIAIFDRHTQMKRHVIEPLSFLYIKFAAKNEAIFPIKSGVFRELGERARFDLLRLEELSADRTRLSLGLRDHYLNDLLLCLVGEPSGSRKAENAALIPSALDLPIAYMKENLESKISVAEIAQSCGMSQSSLESKFRSMLGVSVYDHLISLRLDRAKCLLTETSLPVTDIAVRCGYENLFYFCNAFKKNTSMTPTEYRRANVI